MRRSIVLAASILLLLTSGCSSSSHERPHAAERSPKEMEQAFMEASTPNENHRVLENLVGSWNVESRFWMSPDATPEVSAGRAENHWVYNGRFVQGTYSGSWNGQPFEGTGVWGYDNVTKRYQSTWFDSMSTQMMMSTGTFNPRSRTLELEGEVSCPMTGRMEETKSVTTIVNPNRHIFEMYGPGVDGRLFKTLEITYTRVPTTESSKGKEHS